MSPRESGGCSNATLIQPGDMTHRKLIRLSGSTATGSDTSRSRVGACDDATSGPEVWYELDLQAATRAIEVRAILEASFDAALDLRRGPCADTLSLDCDRGSALGLPGSALAARLEPGVYWLVVDGKDGASRGDFQLQVETDPGNGACPEPPLNVSCETALPFEDAERQTLLVDLHCATMSREADEQERRYYSLDLTSEASPVVARFSRWGFASAETASIYVHREDPQTSDCGPTVARDYRNQQRSRSEAELAALLEPGRYIIELRGETEPPTTPSLLTFRLDRAACRSGPVGNTCEDAVELETAPGSYVLEGSTLCNSEHVNLSSCNGVVAPDQLYRLDLRGLSEPTRARLTVLADGLDISPLMYVLADDGAGGCGEGVYCFDSLAYWEGPPSYDLNLDPALYFIGVQDADGGAGSYRLSVELDRTPPSPCVTSAIDNCVFWANLDFCCIGWDNARCPELVTTCGLASETQRCVCEKNAACCGAAGDTSTCAEAYAACDYLCPDFAPSTYACLDPYR